VSYRRSVSHSEVFDSPASAVWQIIEDWALIVDLMPRGIIASLELEGSGVGAVRHIVTREGVHIAERLDRADQQQGRLELSILDPLPWSMLSYTALAQLDEQGPDNCSLRWEGQFELLECGIEADALAEFLEKSYRQMFKGIRRQLSMTAVPTPYRRGDG
jgi:hypothetical protein